MSRVNLAELRQVYAHRDRQAHVRYIMDALPALLDEFETARKENDFLRLRLAESDKACVYCNLPASEMPRCSSGFPGCARADDLYSCDELSRRDDRMKLIGAAEELELLIGNWRNMRLEDYLPRRAATLRQEAGKW